MRLLGNCQTQFHTIKPIATETNIFKGSCSNIKWSRKSNPANTNQPGNQMQQMLNQMKNQIHQIKSITQIKLQKRAPAMRNSNLTMGIDSTNTKSVERKSWNYCPTILKVLPNTQVVFLEKSLDQFDLLDLLAPRDNAVNDFPPATCSGPHVSFSERRKTN